MEQYVISLDVDSLEKYKSLAASGKASFELADFSVAHALDDKSSVQDLVGR